MVRKIIRIDADSCTGCGLCIGACHEGALQLVNGKAVLISDSYCDGLGACLPECPAGAIAIEERDAAAFDEAAVQAAQHRHVSRKVPVAPPPVAAPTSACGCPGARLRTLTPATASAPAAQRTPPAGSELRQWPCQIKLVPVNAPYFADADLLIAADCSAFACATVHSDWMRGKVTLIGCPKLDGVDYAEKLAAILKSNSIRSVTVLRMEVPCCGGLADAARRAVSASGKPVPIRVEVLGIDGHHDS
jgi:ferredoxin